MTALQWILKEAKKLRKDYPKRFKTWREYVAQASAIYSSKHKGKSPVGKKKAAKKKVARKKVARKCIVGKVHKNKISEQSILNRIHKVKKDVNSLDEAQHKHMIGKIKAKPSIIYLAKKISRLTSINEHSLAVKSLAKFLKQKQYIDVMNNVIKMHNSYGYLPNDLANIRDDIYKKLMLILKHKYGTIDYQTIYKSF